MKFLIKDLSRLTGISPARIRKWQERYGLLQPEKGENGYWYYSDEDYLILKNLKERLDAGEKLKYLARAKREELVHGGKNRIFSEEEMEIIHAIQYGNFNYLNQYLEKKRHNLPLPAFLREVVRPCILLVGRAWESQILSVGDEHTFTRWIMGYLLGIAENYRVNQKPIWLVTVFPGDFHEIGALLHYIMLLRHKIPTRFVGSLPENILIQELRSQPYKAVSISVVLPQKKESLARLKRIITSRTKVQKVYFGGYGLEGRRWQLAKL